uniref:Uncharacterized protein n=1 Tax=Anguilla anguilla TaxID=7936 RepID=A0A0E9Q539_ANGAN
MLCGRLSLFLVKKMPGCYFWEGHISPGRALGLGQTREGVAWGGQTCVRH